MSGFVHERDDFKDLIDITSNEMIIKDPALVEKDYWLMQVLWGLQQLKPRFKTPVLRLHRLLSHGQDPRHRGCGARHDIRRHLEVTQWRHQTHL
jgi:hypothetical protein